MRDRPETNHENLGEHSVVRRAPSLTGSAASKRAGREVALRAGARTLLLLIALVFAATTSLWAPQMAQSQQPQQMPSTTELPYDLQPPGEGSDDGGGDDGGGIGPGLEGAPEGGDSEGGDSGDEEPQGNDSGGDSEGGDSGGEGSEEDDSGGGLSGLLDWGSDQESCEEQLGSRSYTDQFLTLNEGTDLSYTVCPTDNYYLHYLIPEGSEGGPFSLGQAAENGWNSSLNGIASFIFVFNAKFVQFAIEATKFVIEFSLVDQFSEASQRIASALGNGVYTDWYPWIVAIMVIYCGYKWFTGAFTEGWKALLKTVFFLGLALLIMNGGISQNAQRANELANQFTSMGFFAVAGVTNTVAGEDFSCEEEKPVDCVSGNIWDTYVYDPWKSLQISGSDEQFADENAEEVLALANSSDREDKLEELLNENEEAVAPTVDALKSVSHFAAVLFTVFVTGCLILILLLMAIRLVVSEFIVLILVWVSPVWLLVAAVPGSSAGTKMGLWLLEELIQIFLWKLLIGIYLILIVITLSLSIPMGGKAFLIFALTVLAWKKRTEIQRRLVSASGMLKIRERFGESNRERERYFRRDRRSGDVSSSNADSAGLEAGLGASPSPAGPGGGYADFGAHGGRVNGGGANGSSPNGAGGPTLRSSARKARAGNYTGDAAMLAADEHLSSRARDAANRSGIPSRMRKSAGRMADTRTASDARRAQAMQLGELARKRAMNPESLTNNERKRLAQADRLTRQGKNPLKDTNLVDTEMEAVRERRAAGVSPGEHLAGAMRDGESEQQYAERVSRAEAEADRQAERLGEDASARRAVGYDRGEVSQQNGEEYPGGGHGRRDDNGRDDEPGYGGDDPGFTGDGSGSGAGGANADAQSEVGVAEEPGAGAGGLGNGDRGDGYENPAGVGAGRRARFPEQPPFELPENSGYSPSNGVVTGSVPMGEQPPAPPEGSGYELREESSMEGEAGGQGYRWEPTSPPGVQMPEGASYDPDTGVVSGSFDPSSERAPTPPEGYAGHAEAGVQADPTAGSSAMWRWTPDGMPDFEATDHSGPEPTQTRADPAGVGDDAGGSTGPAGRQPDTSGDLQDPDGGERQRSAVGRAWDNYRSAEESAKAEGRAVLLDDAKSGKAFLAPQATTVETLKATGTSLASNLASNFGGSSKAGAQADMADPGASTGAGAAVGGSSPAGSSPGGAGAREADDDRAAGGLADSAYEPRESPADTGSQSHAPAQDTRTQAGFDTQTPVSGTPDTGVSGTGTPDAGGSDTAEAAAEPPDAGPGAGTSRISMPSEGAQPGAGTSEPQSGAWDTGTPDTGTPDASSGAWPPPATPDAGSPQPSMPSDEARSPGTAQDPQPPTPEARPTEARPAETGVPASSTPETGHNESAGLQAGDHASQSPRARSKPPSPRSGGRSARQDFGAGTPSDPEDQPQQQPDNSRKLESQRSRSRRRPGRGRGGRS